jgi:mRNA interferase RelE/StbE
VLFETADVPILLCCDKKSLYHAKLTTSPLQFNVPLSHGLTNFRKLRIGDFRVVYQVQEKRVIVFVLAVGPRRDKEIYKSALKRKS